MNAKGILTALVTIALLLPAAAHAATRENRDLDADASGTAVNTRTGEAYAANLTLDANVIVTTSDRGVDRTAATERPGTLTLDIGGTVYEIPVRVNGEGVSLVQTGVSADAWRLNVQGSSIPTPTERAIVTFQGSFTLLGTDEGYTLDGDGRATVVDGETTTPYALSYTGSAEFE